MQFMIKWALVRDTLIPATDRYHLLLFMLSIVARVVLPFMCRIRGPCRKWNPPSIYPSELIAATDLLIPFLAWPLCIYQAAMFGGCALHEGYMHQVDPTYSYSTCNASTTAAGTRMVRYRM
ncbi:hypothetical protein BDV29DRAFT_122194 [Aspergillus leporis]|jgi:hypothetical protein|uniref:Uncharacterized protein n=1 Tax=Aspergillus leporis TaxID=41062 RepID=A0A5N5X3I2_9EURO|nr:hypothetical protein BDV29DRAFT_122194 [Aspergillus leporis]